MRRKKNFGNKLVALALGLCMIISGSVVSYAAEVTEKDPVEVQDPAEEMPVLAEETMEKPESDEETVEKLASDEESMEKLESDSAGEPTAIGGFQITGGTEGTDYEMSEDGTLLQIKSDAFLTIKNEDPSQENPVGIKIMPGVQARVTLAGVNIKSSQVPLDVATNIYGTADGTTAAVCGDDVIQKTSLYLTLADGTENRLTPAGSTPALHCGEGSKLVIDDSVRNIDSDGKMITPEQGRVPYSCTLENGTPVTKGDPLYVMESKDPGKLTVTAGEGSAAIGSGSMEDAGEMVFNGGYVETYGISSNYPGTGAGIGTGYGGSCTVITINGGTIITRGSYHGAGIGTGLPWGYTGYERPQLSGTIQTRNPSKTCPVGDIYINGGNITAYAGTHGNAIGAGCTNGNNCDNTGHVLEITGGNIMPYKTSYYQLGGTGTDIVITGGSFYCTSFNGDVTDGNGVKLTMATIDLSIYPELKGARLKSYDVLVDGALLEPEYGLANNVDADGKLYFWLSKSVEGKDITISNVVLIDADGNEEDQKYDFTIPDFDSSHTTAKQYVVFEAELSEEEQKELRLKKQYDGLPVDGNMLVDVVAQKGVYTDKPGGNLDDPDAMEFSFQQLTDQFGTAVNRGIISGQDTFENAGNYRLTITSTQYSNDAEFSKTFWGHRAYIDASITPADSKTQDVECTANKADDTLVSCTFHALVRPADGMAKTCKAPGGTVQFYMNGIPVGNPVSVAAAAEDEKENGYAYSTAEYTWDLTGVQIPAWSDGMILVTASYNGGENYTVSETDSDLMENPGIPVAEPPKVERNPENPEEPGTPLEPEGEPVNKPGDQPGDLNTLHQTYRDQFEVPVSGDVLSQGEVEAWIRDRYAVTSMAAGADAAIASVTIQNRSGQETDTIDRTQPGVYHVFTVVADDYGNTSTVDLTYLIYQKVVIRPEDPGQPEDPDDPNHPGAELEPTGPPETDPESGLLRWHLEDTYIRLTEDGALTQKDAEDWAVKRYDWGESSMESLEIYSAQGEKLSRIDLSVPGEYQIIVMLRDTAGNTIELEITYLVKQGESSEGKSVPQGGAQTPNGKKPAVGGTRGQTGDGETPALWAGLLLLAVLALVFGIRLRRRKAVRIK